MLRSSPNVPDVIELDVAGRLVDRLGRPVAVGNDATCAALAEWTVGAGRGVDDMVMVTLGTGIGGGVVAGGRLLVGANGFAGEFGHMVVDPNGPPCPCGRRGCWERYASGSGLAQLARTAAVGGRLRRVVEVAGGDPALVRGEHVQAAAREGDAGGARRDRRVRPLGRARAGQPDQRPRPGGVRARRRAGRGRRPVPGADRALVPGAALRARAAPRTPALAFAELGERAGAIGGGDVRRRQVAGPVR